MANIHINPDAVVEVIAKHFSSKQIDCIREYNAQVKASNGTGIAASKLWNVCASGGLDIKQPVDKEKCRTFVNELTRRGTVKFYEVCDKHKNMIANGTGRCIDNVFSDGIKVTQMIAAGLAKEYARVKYADNDLTCRKTIRQNLLDDYIQCTSMSKNMAYEFKFDSVTSTTDFVIDESTESGICKMYDVKFTPFGSVSEMYLGNGQKVGDYESWPAACETTDASKCSKINETMQKFGRTAKIGSTGSKGNKRNACIIDKDAISPSDLRTAFGIDNYIFKKSGIQLNATTGVRTQVCAYVSQNVKNPAITSCVCNDGYVHLYDFSSGTTETDDVLTCTINNKTVDFVFDDLSEAWDTYDKSGREAMNCLTWGGTFTGKKCMGLDEKMCNVVRDANAQSCPECKKIQWNKKDNVCELPESVSATNLKRGLTYSAIVGGAALSVVITVGTLGTATAPTVLVLTGLSVETLGSVIELKAQHAIYSKTDEFFDKANNCNNQTCAEKLIKEYLQVLSNQQNDMQDSEISAADAIFATLFDKIPANSKFYKDIIEQGIQGKTIASNKRGFFDAKSWNSEQIWRAVGVTLQIIPTLASIGWRIAKKSDKLVKSTAKLRSKLDDASKYIDNALGIGKDAGGIIETTAQTAKTEKIIGFLDEGKMSDYDIDDVIKSLEKEGYRVEYIRTYDGAQGEQYRQYKIVSDIDTDVEIKPVERVFIDNALNEGDLDLRLAAVGLKDDLTRRDPDSWYEIYRQLVVEDLSKDPEVQEAYANWKTMSEWDRYEFIDRTNRKIRHKIDKQALPVSYERTPKGAGASYVPQRHGSDAKVDLAKGKTIDMDEYTFRTDLDFKSTLGAILHENYHFSQDIGKTEMPDWLIDFNRDHYIKPHGVMPGPYDFQPLERNPRVFGNAVSKEIVENLENLKSAENTASSQTASTNVNDFLNSLKDMENRQKAKSVEAATSTTSSQTQFDIESLLNGKNGKNAKSLEKSTSTPPVETKQLSYYELTRKAEQEGRDRISRFRQKYDLSVEGRKKYTKEQWEEILSNELGDSDVEDAFKKDFRNGMNQFYWNR